MTRPAPRPEVRFASLLPVGFAVETNGQRYEVIAVEPYTRTDGTASSIVTWEAGCLECGELFELKQGGTLLPTKWRRCAEHRHAWTFPTKKNPAGE